MICYLDVRSEPPLAIRMLGLWNEIDICVSLYPTQPTPPDPGIQQAKP